MSDTNQPTAPSSTAEGRDADVGDTASVPANAEQSAAGSSEETPVAQGIHTPEVEEPDLRS